MRVITTNYAKDGSRFLVCHDSQPLPVVIAGDDDGCLRVLHGGKYIDIQGPARVVVGEGREAWRVAARLRELATVIEDAARALLDEERLAAKDVERSAAE